MSIPDKIRRLIGKKGDALLGFLQNRGLRETARLACTMLGEDFSESGPFADWEYRTMDRLFRTMCDYMGDDLPPVEETDAVDVAFDFVSKMPPGRQRQIRHLLAVLEAGSLVLAPQGDRARFSTLDDVAADTYVASWAESQIPQRRAVFAGLKSVCMMGYWTRSQTWDAIGYTLEREESP